MARAIDHKDVRELQQLAQDSAHIRLRPRKKRASRAAYLELIDILSRWSAAGLAVTAGISIFLATTVGRAYPVRAAVWAGLLLSAVWVSRRMRSQFRAGATIAARPFRWRASYTSSVSVLGVVFASAPILLTPFDTPSGLFLQTLGLTMFGAFAAALFHAAHLPTASAFAAPGAILPLLAALRNGNATIFLSVIAVSVALCAGVYAFNRVISKNAARRNPRSSFLRREIEPADHREQRDDLSSAVRTAH